jgi:hypothetical protein
VVNSCPNFYLRYQTMSRDNIRYIGIFALMSLGTALVACGGSGYGSGGGGGGSNVLTVAPAGPSLAVGATKTFTASGGSAYACGPYSWTSSSGSVATIGASTGIATAKTVGSTTITASCTYSSGAYGGMTATISGSTTLTVTAMAVGLVAHGAAMAHASVSLKDANGMLAMTTTDEHGRFSLPINGLTPPFRLKAEDGTGRALYSFSLGASVMNITPVTDAAFRMGFGPDAEAAFQGANAGPDAASSDRIEHALGDFLSETLASQGIDPASFSVLSTPFEANHRGFDRVLDNLSESADAGGLRLTDALSGGELRVSFGNDRSIISLTAVTSRAGRSVMTSSTLSLHP